MIVVITASFHRCVTMASKSSSSHAYEGMLTAANMNNHIDVLFTQFFKTYLQATHPNTKVALMGAYLISTSMEALVVQSNELMRNYVDVSLHAYGLSATFVSTYDLEDPYLRVDQTIVHTSDGCADDDETVWPRFLDGWCENQESNRIFDKVGMPRLKGPIGYRGVVQLYLNITSSQDASFCLAPSFTSFAVENDRSILLTFNRPVSFSNATFQSYEIPFRWAGVTSSAYYGYNSGGERIESSGVFVSEDGHVLNITQMHADYFSIAMKSAFYAQTMFTCCNNYDNYVSSSSGTEDLVCPPMNCGLNSLEDPYIPVDIFRTND